MPSELCRYPAPALSRKTFVARSRTRNRATRACGLRTNGAPKGIRILIVLVTIGTRWDSLVRLTGRFVPIGPNEYQQVPCIWATNRATNRATNPGACRRPVQPVGFASGRRTFCSQDVPADGSSLCPADLPESLDCLSAFVRQGPLPAFGEPCDDQAGDLLNSIVRIFKPAIEVVDLRL